MNADNPDKEGSKMTDADTYEDLVRDAKKAYESNQDCADHEDVYMNWVSGEFGREMSEINLWTYWQGYGVRHPKILLVGQDWGCCEQFPQVIKNAQEIERTHGETSVQYFDGNQVFVTDKNLVTLFAALKHEDIDAKRYDDLFFTNLCLGYRNEGNSGVFKNKWMTHDREFFLRLVKVLRPGIILCLGRKTYESAVKAVGFKPRIPSTDNGGYNTFIRSQLKDPIAFEGIPIVALAHPGGMGTANRLRGITPKPKEALSVQIEDWKLVGKYIQDNGIV